ncbi:MAG: 30S ribosomal protein S5 [Patescibacteria group bacterium]
MIKAIPKEIKEVVEEFIPENVEMSENVVSIDRISRTVKGGRRIRFRAIVVVGNRNGQVGVGTGKAADVQGAIAKAKNKADKTMINVPIVKGTISHPVMEVYGTSRVILKPAPQGHSVIAGGSVRAVVELAGISNIVSKSIGSANALNNAMATYLALKNLSKEKGRKKDS